MAKKAMKKQGGRVAAIGRANNPANPDRFLYSAKGVGVAVRVQAVNQFWASCALPIIGGNGSASEGPIVHTFFSFEKAETKVSGTEIASGVHETTVTVTVKNLNILGVIKADWVGATVRSTVDLNTGQRTTVLKGVNPLAAPPLDLEPFVGLLINNQPLAQPIRLDANIAAQAAANYNAFRAGLPGDRPGRHHFRGPCAPPNMAFTTLARGVGGPHPQLDQAAGQPASQFGVLNNPAPSIERVVFCEWWAEPHRRNLTIMRVKLADPPNGSGGEIVVADPDDDGDIYP